MTYHWACTCGATGTDTSTATTDAAHADAKHLKTCAGTVLTATDPQRLAGIAGLVSGGEVAE